MKPGAVPLLVALRRVLFGPASGHNKAPRVDPQGYLPTSADTSPTT